MEANTNPTEGFKPMSEYNPINPTPGVQYIADDEFAKLQNPEPQSETPAEQPAEASNETPAELPDETPAAPAVDYDAWVKEKTGGKFEKWDDLDGFIKEPVKFENEESKLVLDYIREGKFDEVGTFLMQQKILSGVDKMDAVDVIKLQMKISDPEATDEDIADDFQRKYPEPEYDAMGEEQAAKAKRAYERLLSKDGKAAKEALGSLKKELKLPELPKPKETVLKPEEIEAQGEAIRNKVAESVNKALPKLGKMEFVVEDKQQGVVIKHSFDVTAEDKADLTKSYQDFYNDFEARYGQGDQYDGEKLAKERYILNNWEKMLKSASLNAYNQGKLAKVEKTANVNLNPTTQPAIDTKAEADRQAAKAFIKG